VYCDIKKDLLAVTHRDPDHCQRQLLKPIYNRFSVIIWCCCLHSTKSCFFKYKISYV